MTYTHTVTPTLCPIDLFVFSNHEQHAGASVRYFSHMIRVLPVLVGVSGDSMKTSSHLCRRVSWIKPSLWRLCTYLRVDCQFPMSTNWLEQGVGNQVYLSVVFTGMRCVPPILVHESGC